MTQLPRTLFITTRNPPNDSGNVAVPTPEQQRRFGQQAAARMLSFPVVMAHTVAVFLLMGELTPSR